MPTQPSFTLYSSNSTIAAAYANNPNRFSAAPTVPAGNRLVLRVQVPFEARLQRITVYQENGTLVPYTVEVLASQLPYGNGLLNQTTDPVGQAPNVPLPAFRISPARDIAVAGDYMDWRSEESAGGADGVPFVNMDQTTRAIGQNCIYVIILPTGAATTTTWCVTVVTAQQTSF